MDFSVMLLSYPDCWKEVKLAEELGYTNAWFADMQLHASDIYACMALAAEHTSRITLGTAVCAPSNRIAPLTASSIATINQLAPGRVVLGLGVGGFSARRSMGLKPMPVRRFQEYAEQVRGLLQGEDVLYREGKNERWIRLLQHDFNGYLNIQDPIPLYFAAQGPRMLALTGELADGLITAVVGMATTDQQQETIRASMAAVRAGAQAAGRQLADSYYVQITTCGCVLREGESLLAPRVVERMGPFGMLSAHATWEAQHGLQDEVAAEFSRHTASGGDYDEYIEAYAASIGSPPDRRYLDVHKGHMGHFKPGEEQFLTESMIQAALVGPAEEIIERLKVWEAAGVTDIALQVMDDTGPAMLREFADEVMAHY